MGIDCLKNPRLFYGILGVVLRAILPLINGLFERNPEFSTPWNSFKRFREGVFLWDLLGDSVYDGGCFHVMPIFIYVLRNTLDSPLWLRIEWTLLDLYIAYLISEFVRDYIISTRHLANNKIDCDNISRLSDLAFAIYLLNPMSIGCCSVNSLAVIVNAFLATSLLFSIKGNLLISTFSLALAVQLNPYYAILLAPIVIRFKERFEWILALFCFAVSYSTLFALNFSLVNNSRNLFESVIGFFLKVPDLTPNVGLFWYFFIQVFDHYRSLFICTFQLNTVIHVIPISTLLRKSPFLLWLILLIQVSIFSSYPSYAEAALYLPMIIAFVDLHKYFRYVLLIGSTLVATFVLTPIMWHIWIIDGSGNANFYFAIVWIFNLAQVFMSMDLIGGYLRACLVQEYSGGDLKKMEGKFQGIRLVSAFEWENPNNYLQSKSNRFDTKCWTVLVLSHSSFRPLLKRQ